MAFKNGKVKPVPVLDSHIEADLRPPRSNTSAFLLWGMVGGSLAGFLDAWLGIRHLEKPLVFESMMMLALFSAFTLVAAGGFMGLIVRAGCLLFRDHRTFRSIRSIITKPLFLFFMLVLFVGAVVAIRAIIYHRGIQIDAINFIPLLLASLVIAICLVGGTYLAPSFRLARLLNVVLLVTSVGVLGLSARFVGRYQGVLPMIATKTVALSPLVDGFKAVFDNDNDGFATLMCASDCDCNDTAPNISPAAIDIPGNGIDEDCSGKDLLLASLKETLSVGKKPTIPTSKKDILKPPTNIVLITVDALRADHVHAYGYERQTTPNLDRFALENTLFKQVRAQGPSTRHSLPVLLAGRYFSSLALKHGKKWSTLLPENVTFAEELKKKDYQTIAILPYFRFKERSGFSQGFDTWITIVDKERDPVWDPTADLVTDKGIAFLDKLSSSGRPWFLWLHYFDPHGAYVKHPELKSFGQSRVDRYDGEILYTDHHINRVFNWLKERDLWNRTAIILTSDHGEGLGRKIDHGLTYHGFSLFDSEIRIPLIIRLPGADIREIAQPVGLIDIPPTIVELSGLPKPSAYQGVSLVPYLQGMLKPHPPVFSELPDVKRSKMALLDWPYKLIWDVRQNQYTLYQLEKDPAELEDSAARNPKILKTMKAKLNLLRLNIRDTSH